jgi:VCBS repeat-containing protein
MAKPKLEATNLEIFENVGAVSGNLLQNAFDPDGDTITIARVNDGVVGGSKGKTVFQGEYGFLTIQQNGDYTYTLNEGVDVAFGSSIVENFKIKVRDGTGNFDQDHLRIEIKGAEDAPMQTSWVMDFEDPSFNPRDYNGFELRKHDTQYADLRDANDLENEAPSYAAGMVAVNQPGGHHVLTGGSAYLFISRLDGALFNLDSLYISSVYSGTVVRVDTYKNGELEDVIDLNTVDGSLRNLNIEGVNEVRFISSGNPSNYFFVDNIVFSGDWLLA